jgi:hypothetical protein
VDRDWPLASGEAAVTIREFPRSTRLWTGRIIGRIREEGDGVCGRHQDAGVGDQQQIAIRFEDWVDPQDETGSGAIATRKEACRSVETDLSAED